MDLYEDPLLTLLANETVIAVVAVIRIAQSATAVLELEKLVSVLALMPGAAVQIECQKGQSMAGASASRLTSTGRKSQT